MLISAVLVLSLGLPGDGKIAFDGPGWYRVTLKTGHQLKVQVSGEAEGSYRCKLEGELMEIPASRIASLEAVERGPGSSLTGDRQARCRQAIDDLAAANQKVVRRAYARLRKEFPASREILHASLRNRHASVRKLVVKLLGEIGEPEEDGPPVARLLRDTDGTVRLAAVMALRRVGARLPDSLFEYLRWESVVNYRKAAVKTLQAWKDPEVVPPLVDLMQVEKDHGVRRFMAQVLRFYLKTDLGEDPRAWKLYLEDTVRKQAKSGAPRETGEAKEAKTVAGSR